jgi:hypothetical protein
MTEPWMEAVKANIEARKLAQESRWDRDEFGIPLKPKGEESARDRLLREAKTLEAAHINLSAIYRRLQEELGGGKDGVRKARRCFDYFASQKPKYAKGQHGSNDQLNERLLEIYDEYRMAPSDLGKAVHSALPRKFGNSAEAIEKKVYRLLKEREKNAGGEIRDSSS